jgi:hypothetical protein
MAPGHIRGQDGQDWQRWHDDYADPRSAMSQRLDVVRGHIETWLDAFPYDEVTVVSACAGQGDDLLQVLGRRADHARVRATLLEFDPVNAAVATATVARLGLERVTVRCRDAGDLASYVGAVPADLILFAGIFGNISHPHIERSIHALPRLCAPGATVIWTRTRRPPDATPLIRGWFAAAGFAEVAFDAPEARLFSVGVHRLQANPEPLGRTVSGRIFQFLRPGTATGSG